MAKPKIYIDGKEIKTDLSTLTKEIKIELFTAFTAECPSAVKKSLTTVKSADILIGLKTK